MKLLNSKPLSILIGCIGFGYLHAKVEGIALAFAIISIPMYIANYAKETK